MYVCFLDATKAFDRVDYAVLFQKILSRNVPGYIVRFLWNWYSKHCTRILWAGILSDSFKICSGVRQGGILSPFLFAIYIDQLSVHLQTVNVGCRVGNLIVNHIYSAPLCKRCIGYGNSVCLSVRPSHAGIVSKRRHVARCSLHCRIAKCV